ncbi:hypothetical protein ACROYT_G035644, partial [Oculina patagonica]
MEIWRRALQGYRNFNHVVSLYRLVSSLSCITTPLLGRVLFKRGVRIYGEKANFGIFSGCGSFCRHCMPGISCRLEKVSIEPNKTSVSAGQLAELHCVQNVLLRFLYDSTFVGNNFVAESEITITEWDMICF